MFPRTRTTSCVFTSRLTLAATVAGAVALLALMPSGAWAQGKGKPTPPSASVPEPVSAGSADKLDVSDLEKKYWAAKDTDFSVVQNRLFSKTNRLGLSVQYGGFVSDPWSEGATLGANLNFYFSERYGIELAYSNTDSTDTQATSNLKINQNGAPNHNKMKGFYGAAFNWVPFYAKVSVLNSSIIYFDMAISPGVGMVEYEQQLVEGGVRKSAPAFTLDITQSFFLNRWFALRFDYKNRWFQEDITQYRTPGGVVPRTTTTDLNQTSLFMLGVTLFY